MSNIVALGLGEIIVVEFGCPIIPEIIFCPLTALAVADLVLRKLGKAVHKRPESLHIFKFSKTMLPLWSKLIYKVEDLVVYPPPLSGGGKVLANFNIQVFCH